MADIVFSFNNREKEMVIPWPPASNPIEEGQNHERFEGLNGPMLLIGKPELRKFSFSSTFPMKKHRSMRPGSIADGWAYVDFFREARDRKIPLRVIFLYADQKINMACLIHTFSIDVKKNGNIAYNISGEEYRFPQVDAVPAPEEQKPLAEEFAESVAADAEAAVVGDAS